MRGRGRFQQPASSAEAIEELEDLASPIGAFLRDRCTVAPGRSVQAQILFDAWTAWCAAQGRDHAGTIQTFGRDLRAAVPGLKAHAVKSCRFSKGLRGCRTWMNGSGVTQCHA